MNKPIQAAEDHPWYIFRAATRQEKRACESLAELKIEHYLPCETVTRKICREDTKVDRALFPGYIFARVPDRMFHAAINADGVHAPVRVTNASGERVPRVVSKTLVIALQIAQASGEFDRTIVPPAKPLVAGDTVFVVEGPFEGKVGSLLEMRPKDRVALLLSGRTVEMDLGAIEAAA